MTEMDHYVVDTHESFQGKTADTLRETVKTRISGLHKSYMNIEELMIKSLLDIVNAGNEVFGSDGIVDTEFVKEVKALKQREVNDCIYVFEEINRTLASIDDIINLGRIDVRDLEDLSVDHKNYSDQVIEKVYDFNTYIKDRMTPVHEAIDDMSAEFGIPLVLSNGLDFAKLTDLKKPKNKQKEIFIANMMEMYGFSKEESKIMYKMFEGIVDQYPDEDDMYHSWLFTRLIAYIGTYNDWKWDNTAGTFPNEFKTYIELANYYYCDMETVLKGIEELGLSELEVNVLYIAIDRQHLWSSYAKESFYEEDGRTINYDIYTPTHEKYKKLYNIPDMPKEEFEKLAINDFNRFEGTGEFSHQMSTLSTGLSPQLALVANIYTGNKTFISSGYYGDVTDIAGGANLGNDDYIADLDSDNIFHRYLKNGGSFMSVFNDYNSDILNGSTSRSEEFLNNHGGIEGITKELYGKDMEPDPGRFRKFDLDKVDSDEAKEASKKFLEALDGKYSTLNNYETDKGK